MIKIIKSASDLKSIASSFYDVGKIPKWWHISGAFSVSSILQAWASDQLLVYRSVVVASVDDNGYCDAIIMFQIDRDARFNKICASNYLWYSKAAKNGIRVFQKALKLLKNKNVEIINIGISVHADYRLIKYLRRLGFDLDCHIYTKIIS